MLLDFGVTQNVPTERKPRTLIFYPRVVPNGTKQTPQMFR